MLGCIICKKFYYYIDTFSKKEMDKDSVKESIKADYCNDLGFFMNICYKTLDAYYDDMWNDSVSGNVLSIEERCEGIGLCPTLAQMNGCSTGTDSKYSIYRDLFINTKNFREEL
uniref:Saposin B-type domain-containing protein n=1 Tax=Parastrongyloides trichosuri TaxID=131310 RepID=A0A0N4ZCN6_PARTI